MGNDILRPESLQMRPTWDECGMLSAFAWAIRPSCCFHKIGVVILSADHELIGEGYNGSPRGMLHCTDVGCAKKNDRGDGQTGDCIGLHAEENAINHVADKSRLRGATIYTTLQPCVKCASRIIHWGISRVVAAGEYVRIPTDKDGHSDELYQTLKNLSDAGIEFQWFEPVHEEVGELIKTYSAWIDRAIDVSKAKALVAV